MTKTFRISFEKIAVKEVRQPIAAAFETLRDAIDEYCPRIKVTVIVGSVMIAIDPCRDLYGLHEDLLDLIECVTFDRESDIGYPEILPRMNAHQKTYGIFLTEGTRPRILACRAEAESVHIETRTLIGGGVQVTDEDRAASAETKRTDFMQESVEFLTRYMNGLAQAIPGVLDLDSYRDYQARLESVRAKFEIDRHGNRE